MIAGELVRRPRRKGDSTVRLLAVRFAALALVLSGDARLQGEAPSDDRPMSLRYVRPAGAKFVLESRITETKTKDGVTYTSLTDRGSEKMTLKLRFDAKNQLRDAEAVQETAKGKETATLVFK